MDEPWGDPTGDWKQRLWWRLGFRLVPTDAERLFGVFMMITGGMLLVVAAVAFIHG